MQIAQQLDTIIDLIRDNGVILVVAPTGSGKSIAIPAAVASVGSRCFVSVPTVSAAISLASYERLVLEASDQQIAVGHAAEGEIHYNDNTQVAYVTSGHLRRKLLSLVRGGVPQPILFCDVLIVDEVHVGSIDNSVILSLWSLAASQGLQVPRLVLASATPSPISLDYEPALYTLKIDTYPIGVRYQGKDYDPEDDDLYTGTANLAVEVHRTTPVEEGGMLIFAPGSAEVETLARLLTEAKLDHVRIIPAYGTMRQEEIARIYEEVPPDTRRIVIATNIAESAITIADLGIVIDTLVEKRAETSMTGGLRLVTTHVSKDSAKQRAGRTGRTRAGTCYRMSTAEGYELLEEHRPVEVLHIPIYDVCMELFDAGLDPQLVLRGVPGRKLADAVGLLTKLGMLTQQREVTNIGHFAPNYPLGIRNSAFLWHWLQGNHPPFPGIVVAVLMDCYGPSYFWIPRRRSDQSVSVYNNYINEYKEQYFGEFRGSSDLTTYLNMWGSLMVAIGGYNPQGFGRRAIRWAQEKSVNAKKLRELFNIVAQTVRTTERLGYRVVLGPFTTDGVMDVARPILERVYADRIFYLRRGKYIQKQRLATDLEYRLDTRDTYSKLTDNKPPSIIAIITREIVTSRGTIRLVSFAIESAQTLSKKPIKGSGDVLSMLEDLGI